MSFPPLSLASFCIVLLAVMSACSSGPQEGVTVPPPIPCVGAERSCPDGYVCSPWSNCVATAGLGASCTLFGDKLTPADSCTDGLYCTWSETTCAPRLPEGALCLYNHDCLSSLACLSNAVEQSLPVCTAAGSALMQCTSSLECRTELACKTTWLADVDICVPGSAYYFVLRRHRVGTSKGEERPIYFLVEDGTVAQAFRTSWDENGHRMTLAPGAVPMEIWYPSDCNAPSLVSISLNASLEGTVSDGNGPLHLSWTDERKSSSAIYAGAFVGTLENDFTRGTTTVSGEGRNDCNVNAMYLSEEQYWTVGRCYCDVENEPSCCDRFIDRAKQDWKL